MWHCSSLAQQWQPSAPLSLKSKPGWKHSAVIALSATGELFPSLHAQMEKKKCTTEFPHSAQGDPLSILTFITEIQEGLKAFGFPCIILLKSCFYRLLLSPSISLLPEPRDSISPAERACTSPSSKAISCQIQEGKQNTSLLAKCLHTNLCNCPRLWRGPRVHTALTLSLEIQLSQMHQTQLTGWFMSNLYRWWLRKVTLIQTCWKKQNRVCREVTAWKTKVNSFIYTSPSSSISAH